MVAGEQVCLFFRRMCLEEFDFCDSMMSMLELGCRTLWKTLSRSSWGK